VQCVAGKLARMPRGSERKPGHPQRRAPEGGGSASPTSPRSCYCAQGNGKGAGRFCSPREEDSGELSGEGEATVMKFDDGGGRMRRPAALP
jgi:hypothetical protein